MNIQQFIDSKYIDSLSESQKQYLIEHKKFKDRSVIEKRLADKFEDVRFTGRGSDVDIRIGEYKWITTMEFLKEVRERYCCKIDHKRMNKDKSTEYHLLDTLNPFNDYWINDNYYPNDIDLIHAQQSLNMCDLEEDKEMDDDTRRYREFMKLYYIYILTPVRKRKNQIASCMNLYYVIVNGSFDPKDLTVEFVEDGMGNEVGNHREGLVDIDNSEFCCGCDYDDNIITEIELPYIMKALDNVTAYRLAYRYDFTYDQDRYCDLCQWDPEVN